MLALYADDAAYVTTSLTGPHAAIKMQRALDALPTWLKDWRLKVNVAKTQAISIGRSAWTPAPPPVSLLGETVDWSPTAKYLGVTIDRGLLKQETSQQSFIAKQILLSEERCRYPHHGLRLPGTRWKSRPVCVADGR
ncbi:jg26517 [Pararge aegeria aegeria]|uniref:Jg26517 protein n=1 Tax=Pararge aegeria aegeria TaxID=348720 RepID=A0A8S4QDI2_9NEOP|nr:jg26517 [Pararge aegeria aegeria]